MADKDVDYAQLLFSMGSVMVYELKPQLFGKTTYFWKYRDGIHVFGPFTSIMEATQNWESTMIKPNPAPSNVIHVDFKKKKRIK